MGSGKWLTVFVACALVACANARPSEENDIEGAHIVLSNEISSSTQVAPVASVKDTKENNESPESKQTEANASDHETEETGVAETDESTKQNKVKAVVDKAVHELFPHAVLFGGTCGGTIISPSWILTAGHCTLFTGGRYVLAGTNHSMDGSGVERRVKRLVIHPLFSVGPYWLDADSYHITQVAANWDFLLAELEEPLPLDGRTMAAVELDDQITIPEGLEVGYAGYGAKHHGETMRHEMHGMELEVQPDSVCKEALEQFDTKNMICTKGRPPRYDSACNGDSGSGLVANGKVYGVASWVENDAHRCYNGALVVFSRVGAVRDWIRQVTKI